MIEKVFVSYAMQDRKKLSGLKKVLEKYGVVQGDEVSIVDPFAEPMLAGSNIRETIKAQIKSASKVVVIYSSDSTSSNWMNYEIGLANALDKPIIVVGQRGAGKTSLLSSIDNIRIIEQDIES